MDSMREFQSTHEPVRTSSRNAGVAFGSLEPGVYEAGRIFGWTEAISQGLRTGNDCGERTVFDRFSMLTFGFLISPVHCSDKSTDKNGNVHESPIDRLPGQKGSLARDY